MFIEFSYSEAVSIALDMDFTIAEVLAPHLNTCLSGRYCWTLLKHLRYTTCLILVY